MGFRRLIVATLFYIYRLTFSAIRQRRVHLFIATVLVGYLIVLLYIQIIATQPDMTTTTSSRIIDSNKQQSQTTKQRKSILNKHAKYQKKIQTSSKKGKRSDKSLQNAVKIPPPRNFTEPSIPSNETMMLERRLRYSVVDIDRLGVDINYLDEKYQPPAQLFIDLPSPDSHPLSRILNVKGDISVIFYNRIPHCYEFTMNSLLLNISYLHSYKYVPSRIHTPFSYNELPLLHIAKSLITYKYNHLIYERHIYFFDFYKLQMPTHPIWINLVRDPIYRVAVEYNRSREVCLKTNRCFVEEDTINETLDECVVNRSPQDCISPSSGVSRMLPFFCGLTYPLQCQDEDDWAFEQAKQNIDYYYTVVGIAEEFYKFLYVLEKLLPQYFKLARLLFMNQHDPKLLADERDINIVLPNLTTINILKQFLGYEYNIYYYIKQRFLNQYQILVDLDN